MNDKRILVPVDFEKDSLDALHFVAALAGEMPVFPTLLHVANLNILAPERRICDELRRENEHRLRALAKMFFHGQPAHVCARIGRPHEQILAEAESAQAELIVMAAPQTSPTRWLFYPTTVERVARNAPCITLVLPRVWKITPEHCRQAIHPERPGCSNFGMDGRPGDLMHVPLASRLRPACNPFLD